MRYEIDHVFLLTDVGGDFAAEFLIERGLVEGPPARHLGQGTASRRFFFENAMLELLWVSDEAEVRSERVRRLGLWERWKERRLHSPFGICLRSNEKAPPFEAWTYAPPYWTPVPISIAETAIEEPFLFFFPDRPRTITGPRRFTRVHVRGPFHNASQPFLDAMLTGAFTAEIAPGYGMELTFDDGLVVGL